MLNPPPKPGDRFHCDSKTFCNKNVVWTVVDVEYQGLREIGFRATCDRAFPGYVKGERQFFLYSDDRLFYITHKSRWQLIAEDINGTT